MVRNTIFFGNGLNYLESNNISLEKLLTIIKGDKQFESKLLPNTLTYERIILEKYTGGDILKDSEYPIKKEIANLLDNVRSDNIYKLLYNLEFENYITTNYDCGFIDSLLQLKEINFIDEYTPDSEKIYSIRRVKRISNTKEKKKLLWQIHGEIRYPATIMLGLDQYRGSIGRIDNYINGNYPNPKNRKEKEVSIEDKFQSGFTESSWIELFFNTNIHIIGFSLDFCEIDLWWLLNKRARMKKSGINIENEIHFYCPKHEIEIQKTELMESFGIIVHTIDIGNNYPDIKFYEKILSNI